MQNLRNDYLIVFKVVIVYDKPVCKVITSVRNKKKLDKNINRELFIVNASK